MTERILEAWVGQDVTVTVAHAEHDKHYAGRLESVGSDGCLLQLRGGVESGERFFPWQAVREVRLGR